jgi:hypothetical protein
LIVKLREEIGMLKSTRAASKEAARNDLDVIDWSDNEDNVTVAPSEAGSTSTTAEVRLKMDR